MLRLSLALTLSMALLAGCDATSEANDAAFDANFTESCTTSATAGGAVPMELASAYCDCALDRINETYPGMDKLTLTQEQVQPIMLQCVAEVQPNG